MHIVIIRKSRWMTQFSNRYFTLVLMVFLCWCNKFSIYAQNYGNEWINYSQNYLRIDVSETGIYRIPYQVIASAYQEMGLNIATINHAGFQIYGRGEQIPIYIYSTSSVYLREGSYIEFYAQKNDGWFDKQLYPDEIQPNPYYSLYNDTAAYYLTWSDKLNGLRYTVQTDQSFTSYNVLPYFTTERVVYYTSNYTEGELYTLNMSSSMYNSCEGWMDYYFSQGRYIGKTIQTPNPYTSGPNAEVTMGVCGLSSPKHHLNISFLGQTFDTIYSGFQFFKVEKKISPSLLNTSNNFIFKSVDDVNSASDYHAVSYIKIKYPHTTTLENATSYAFSIDQYGSGLRNVLQFTSSNISGSGNDTVLLFDLTAYKKIKVSKSGTLYKAVVDNSSNKRSFYMTSENDVKTLATLMPVNGTGQFTNVYLDEYKNADYIIISHPELWTTATQYKQYRMMSGYPRTYKCVLVNIEELYEQFAYGIRKNPVAIRNFARFIVQNTTQTFNHFFLIGKGYRSSASGSYVSYRKSPTYYKLCLIPSFGAPPSDAALVYFSQDGVSAPQQQVSIGRIAARNNDEVTIYLNKVKQYEAALRNPQPWMKNILHFAGGNDGSQNQTFKAYLSELERIAKDTLMGCYVRTYSKTSTQPIQINQSDSLRKIINQGVSMMTFFAHAAGVGFDMSIDNPEEYANDGKYPFLIGNSCYAGDIFRYDEGDNTSSSMRFTFLANKGTIGYLSAVSSGVDVPMYRYSRKLYQTLSSRCYGKTFGEALQQTVNTFSSVDEFSLATVLDMIYQGDPGIAFYYMDHPDYSIVSDDVEFNRTTITTEMSSFDMYVNYYNYGKAIKDTNFVISVNYKYPDGSDTTYLITKSAPYYKDTFMLKLPISRVKSQGINTITIQLDPYNKYEELTKNNNKVTITLNIASSGIIPIYPQKYAIIPKDSVVLIASTGQPFAEICNYIFQIDTTPYFKNNGMMFTQISSSGGIVQWSLPMKLQPNEVYYWRVKSQNDTVWAMSSFEYYPDKTGSGQSDFYQFSEDTYQYSNYNETQKTFDFVQDLKTISVQNFFEDYAYYQWQDIYFKVNGTIKSTFYCTYGNGLKIAVFDSISGELWKNTYHAGSSTPNGDYLCRDYDTYCFDFYTYDSAWRSVVEQFIQKIPNGNYVLIYSSFDMQPYNFSESLYQAFENLGSTQIRSITGPVPYILFGVKGAKTGDPRVVEVVGVERSSKIQLNTTIQTNWNEGVVETVPFGPSSKWNAFQYSVKLENEIPVGDKNIVSVSGTKATTSYESLITGLTDSAMFIQDLSPYINTRLYPYLKVKLLLKDTIHNTSPQIKSVRLFHETAPETAVSPPDYYMLSNNVVQEGDSLFFGIATRNISDKDMDSLLVAYNIYKNNKLQKTYYKRLMPHPAGHVLKDSIGILTEGMSGDYILQVWFNPDNDQLEMYSFNNYAEVSFKVVSDNINPLLDITFDGYHILDGELISAKPLIKMELKDENQFLLMNDIKDTSLFRILLLKPEATEYQRIYFVNQGVEVMEFHPAVSSKNKCYILWNPSFDQDGTYKLKVEAVDKSGNLSGDYDYEIAFEIINKSTITGMFNYPNPFSTSTRFVFTLTGSQIPTDLRITIMTISGKVVKEIGLDEFGEIRIGNNISQYAWNGRDMYGDLLANGVYLYRVMIKINGSDIDKNQEIESMTSKYFKHDFGKMVIIR